MDVRSLDSLRTTFAELDRAAAGPSAAGGAGEAAAPAGSFKDLLGGLVEASEASQGEASRLVESLAKGEPQDLHRVMSALNEADLSFRLVLEVRNKLVEAWQEIKRMPI
jgi:flagellar hook-basal body complex protein FliE